MTPGKLFVHTRTGVIEVPLIGDPKLDAALLRIARRGGTVTNEHGEVFPHEPRSWTLPRTETAQVAAPPGVVVDTLPDVPGDLDAQLERVAIQAEEGGNA